MKPAPFDYARPTRLAEALELLASRPDAKVLAGGQSLIPLLNFRLASPGLVVDIKGLSGLRGVEAAEGGLRIGALTRHTELLSDPLVRAHAPLLREAAQLIGHEAIRSRGTIGGSVVHADPAAELPLVLHVLEARMRLQSSRGKREVPARDFFEGFMLTACESDEILTEILLPPMGPKEGCAIAEYARRDGDFAIVAACARVGVDGDGRIRLARLALGGVGPGPMPAPSVETALVGGRSEEEIRQAVSAVEADIEPEDDAHASQAYRTHLARVLAEQALLEAWGRAETGRVA